VYVYDTRVILIGWYDETILLHVLYMVLIEGTLLNYPRCYLMRMLKLRTRCNTDVPMMSKNEGNCLYVDMDVPLMSWVESWNE
jgi:hypothetical protein